MGRYLQDSKVVPRLSFRMLCLHSFIISFKKDVLILER